MDDKRFDDVIKNKVGEYVDPNFDEGAIGGLHQYLSTAQPIPWYVLYRSPLIIAGTLALFTLFNWMIIRDYASDNNDLNTTSFNEEMGKHQGLISDLREEVDRLKDVKVDTVFISSDRNVQSNPISFEKASAGVSEEEIIRAFLVKISEGGSIGRIGDFYFYHEDELPSLKEFLALGNKDTELDGSSLAMAYPQQDTLWKEFQVEQKKADSGAMPVLVIRGLEKHYSKGIGLKLGIEAEIAANKPDLGSGEALPGFGLLTELVFSPSLGLETGLKFKNRSYTISDPSVDVLSSYPDINDRLGEVQSIEVDSRLLEIPVNLKYYYPIRQGREVYFGLGLSPNLYLSQVFEYGHPSEAIPDLPADFSLNNTVEKGKPKFYLGTFNAGTGMSFDLRNKRAVQIGLFYQKTLKDVGVEERGMSSYGLKASYWWRLR